MHTFYIIFVIILIGNFPGSSDVLRVPYGFKSIQKALDAAQKDDSIIVDAGIYKEHLLWPSINGIKLIGKSGSSQTILDADGDTGSLCGIHDTCIDTTTLIKGFTFRGAYLVNK